MLYHSSRQTIIYYQIRLLKSSDIPYEANFDSTASIFELGKGSVSNTTY